MSSPRRGRHGRAQAPEGAEHVALQTVERSGSEPVGAWRLRAALSEAGIELAEATAGRLLRELEEAGYLRSVGNRGRSLTPKGRRRLRQLDVGRRTADLSEALKEVANAESAAELLDLLHVRRALERESVRLACERASDEELKVLWDILSAQQEKQDDEEGWIVGWTFHAAIARASHNRLVDSLFEVLFGANQRGLGQLSHRLLAHPGEQDMLGEHGEIVEALERRDADAAERAMLAHMDAMIVALDAVVPDSAPKRRPK